MKRSALQQKTPLVRKAALARTSSLSRNIIPKEPRQRKCAVKTCRAEFAPDPRQPFKTWCSDECGTTLALAKLAKARAAQAKAERAETKAAKEKLKTRRDYMKEAQVAFNAFIRERDRQAGHACISSGRPLDWSGNAVDAGHYRSVGSAPHLRFNEDNCHAQSKHDNQWKSGNAVDYRLGLITRIGLARVEALEADQGPRRYTVDQLIAIRDNYRAKLRSLKKAREQ